MKSDNSPGVQLLRNRYRQLFMNYQQQVFKASTEMQDIPDQLIGLLQNGQTDEVMSLIDKDLRGLIRVFASASQLFTIILDDSPIA